MKKLLSVALVAATSLSLPTSPLTAGDDEAIAAIGGFVVGLITGSIVERDTHTVYRNDYRAPTHCRDYHGSSHNVTVRHYTSDSRYGHRDYREPTGRWETRRIKKWVPGWWEVSYNHCGDRIKVWREGHYRWETERVWVSFCDSNYSHRR
jgi:hypothetical protein